MLLNSVILKMRVEAMDGYHWRSYISNIYNDEGLRVSLYVKIGT